MSQAQQDPQSAKSVPLAPSDQAIALQTENDSPKFGRLLIILFIAVMLIIVITFASEAYYSN